jgi:hypothetical protein
MTRRKTAASIALALALASPGCGTLYNLDQSTRPFGGVRTDVQFLGEAAHDAPESADEFAFVSFLFLIAPFDLTLSAVGDLVTLPYTIPASIRRADEEEKAREARRGELDSLAGTYRFEGGELTGTLVLEVAPPGAMYELAGSLDRPGRESLPLVSAYLTNDRVGFYLHEKIGDSIRESYVELHWDRAAETLEGTARLEEDAKLPCHAERERP